MLNLLKEKEQNKANHKVSGIKLPIMSRDTDTAKSQDKNARKMNPNQ